MYRHPCITELRINGKETRIEKRWKTKETTVNKSNELEIIQFHKDNRTKYTIKEELSELAGYDNTKPIQEIV